MPSPYPTRGIVSASDLAALYADPDVLPFLPSRDFIAEKSASFQTTVRRSANGREVRRAVQQDAIWRWTLKHSFARDLAATPELQALWGFFVGRQGRYGAFFFQDPTEAAVSAFQFGTGDGSRTTFQVMRPVGLGTPYVTSEPVRAFWNTPAFTVNGSPPTTPTVNPWGTVTFVSAPSNGAVLRWSGNPLFVCRFDDDALSASEFAQSFWEPEGFSFVGIRP